jgi:hypothetical protein
MMKTIRESREGEGGEKERGEGSPPPDCSGGDEGGGGARRWVAAGGYHRLMELLITCLLIYDPIFVPLAFVRMLIRIINMS